MAFDDDYFVRAQKVIMGVLINIRPKLMQAFGRVSYDLKADSSVITELDKEVETLLKNALRDFDSTVGFLGEEFGQEGSTQNYWLIDPIDGTEAFIRGIPNCRNQLAFMSDGQPLFALVYRFPTEDLFVARLGKGTTKNGQTITIGKLPLNRCLIEMSINLLDPATYQAFCRLRPKIAGMTVMRDYLPCVEGLVNGIICWGDGGPWDYVPRALLLSEAGASVGNKGTMEYDPADLSLVSIHPDNFKQLQKLLSAQA